MMDDGVGRSGASAPSGYSAEPEPCSTVSAVPVSIPNAARAMAVKPFSVYGMVVTSRQIADAIDLIANLPQGFGAFNLARALLPNATGHERQEATNRLFQRWRKLGLVTFERGRWNLPRGAWEVLQAIATEARRAETPQSGSVHEGAGPQDIAQPLSGGSNG